MNEVLISERFLVNLDHGIEALLPSIRNETSIDCNDPEYGVAFRRFLLFAHWPYLLENLGLHATTEGLLYNKYYWMLRFSKLYERKHGFDAGIEQQAFKILESASFELDWNVVEHVTSLVDREHGERP
jgi:hypothetical protein